jgi:hypothetical protein
VRAFDAFFCFYLFLSLRAGNYFAPESVFLQPLLR